MATKQNIRVTNNYSFVDILVDTHDDKTFYSVYYRCGKGVWVPPTVIKNNDDRETNQLRALYAALARMTCNARVQVHGIDDSIAKQFFSAKHTGNQQAWRVIDAIRLIGLNGNIFDIVKCNEKHNTNLEKAEVFSWAMENEASAMDSLKKAVAPDSIKAIAAHAPVAKAVPTAQAKAEPKVEAKAAATTDASALEKKLEAIIGKPSKTAKKVKAA